MIVNPKYRRNVSKIPYRDETWNSHGHVKERRYELKGDGPRSFALGYTLIIVSLTC